MAEKCVYVGCIPNNYVKEPTPLDGLWENVDPNMNMTKIGLSLQKSRKV
jgi:hypothetical protein